MDQQTFDALARSVGALAGTRRALLRLMTGGALVSVAIRLGLVVKEAGAIARKPKPRTKHDHDAAAKRQGQLHAEGKRKKKRRKRPNLGVVCSLDPECEAGGGHCCADGKCAAAGACCSNEKPCGGDCIMKTSCCPTYEKVCDDGSCVPRAQCCLEEYRCQDGTCIAPLDECCPDQKRCDNGACVATNACCPDARPSCSPCEEAVCDNGAWVCRSSTDVVACQTCPAGSEFCASGLGDPPWD
jgi:hypothetical protein